MTRHEFHGRRVTASTELIRSLAILPNAVLAISALAALVLTSFASAKEPLPFRHYKSIELSEAADETIVRVLLDSDVYATTRARFPDIRVLNAKGIESPFRLEPATTNRRETIRKPCQSEILSLDEHENGSITITLKLDDDAPAANGLSIVTPLTNHERLVSISGSRNGDEWSPLVTDGRIFDFSRYMDVSNREIELPKNQYRQFKVKIADVTELQQSQMMRITRELQGEEERRRTETTLVRSRPFRVDRIDCWSEETRRMVKGNQKTQYPIIAFETEENSQEKSTVITLQTRREPLTSLTLSTSSQNFSRHASVQVPIVRGAITEWTVVGHSTLLSVHVGNFQRDKLEITIPEQRENEYRIVIRNEDSPPLNIDGLETEGNLYQLVFFMSDSEPSRVYYGSETVDKPTYDTSAVLASLKSGYRTTQARLGAEVTNPDFTSQSGTALQRLLNNKLFLLSVICLVVAALAWTLFHASRRIDGITE
ncbi:DUF3999 family protein [Rubripirellula sp.]|nr:DUF3999 family protein [Rubripirellula sp.]